MRGETNTPPPGCVSIEDLGEELGIPSETLHNATARGLIPKPVCRSRDPQYYRWEPVLYRREAAEIIRKLVTTWSIWADIQIAQSGGQISGAAEDIIVGFLLTRPPEALAAYDFDPAALHTDAMLWSDREAAGPEKIAHLRALAEEIHSRYIATAVEVDPDKKGGKTPGKPAQ